MTTPTIHSMFAQVARAQPDSIALCSAAGTTTYRTLLRRAVRVARALRERGVSPGAQDGGDVAVAVALPRSEDAVAAMLGVALAGAAFVPIDPEHPVARQRFIADDAAAVAILTTRGSALDACSPASQCIHIDSLLPADSDTSDDDGVHSDDDPGIPLPDTSGDRPLYILYTSGSTGRPKGVVGTHAAALGRLRWGWDHYPFAPSEVVCHRTSPTFVDAIVEMFSGLLRGVPTAIVQPREMTDLSLFVAALQRHRVTRVTVVPSLLAALLRATPALGTALDAVRLWISSGEALPADLLRRFRAAHPRATLLNLYGSTEVAGDVTCAAFPPDAPLPTGRVPIGAAIADAELLVLDEHMREVVDGDRGELHVGGPVLARGYHARPEENARRFVPHPARDGARLFRTGDIVRRTPDGQLEYLGRADHQVKINGHRVELEDIEHVVAQGLPADARVAAAVIDDGDPLRRRLCVFAAPSSVNTATLRDNAAAQLPAAVVPTRYIALDALPLTPTGKLDRLALADIARTHRSARDATPPETPREQHLAALLSRVLGASPADRSIGRHDSLARLGADSLATAEVLAELFTETGVRLSPALVRDATVADLARRLDAPPAPASDKPASEHTNQRFEALPAQDVDTESLARFAVETFIAREPLLDVLPVEFQTFLDFIAPGIAYWVTEAMSFVARDRDTGELVGFCIAHDLYSDPDDEPPPIPASLGPVFALLGDLEHAYMQRRDPLAPGEVVELFMSGAAPTVDGSEIVTTLEARAVAAARERRFRQAVTTCTHRATSQLAIAAGFQRVAARSYQSFEVDGARPFATVAAPHVEAVFYALDLD